MTGEAVSHNLIGHSPAMMGIIDWIGRVAPKDATVLIRGESGTGKELVAEAIHRNSSRRIGPFIAVNCAAVPDELLESEFFGFEKGAFTGAVTQKKGKIELAHGGTLFLDEIGEMKAAMQVKLLRVLQERKVERLGGVSTIHVNIRVIAATNRNLESAVTRGEFREDLYYRLRVICLTIPPLRERPEDLLPLALHFVTKYAGKHGRDVRAISSEACAILERYDWPGNVRELEHAMESAAVLGSGEIVLPHDLPHEVVTTPPRRLLRSLNGLAAVIEQAQRYAVENALIRTGGRCTEAAQLLKIHERTVYRYIERFNLTHLLKG